MKKNIINLTLFLIILIACTIPNSSYAANKTQIVVEGLDRAPRLSYDVDNKDYFTIYLTENGDISSVKLEKIENGKSTILLNKNSKENVVKKGISISSDMKEIKISSKFLNFNNYTQFKLTTYDNNNISKNGLISYFRLKKLKTKSSEKGWYSMNDSPRLKYEDGFKIKVWDYNGIKSLEVKDLKNKNAVVNIGSELGESTDIMKFYNINLSKLVPKDDMYFLQITAIDKTGSKRVEKIIVKTEKYIYDENNKNITYPSNIELEQTVLMLDNTHYRVAKLNATLTPSNAVKNEITWSSSNEDIATVDSQGNVKAKKVGDVVITAKTANGKIAKCDLKVISHMEKASKNTKGAVKGIENARTRDKKHYTYWIVKKEKFSDEQVESYINNAEILCKTGDYEKYPESKALTLPIYKNGTRGRTTMKKEQGLSANDYLILATTTNQRVYIFHKKDGVWKKVREDDCTSGKYWNNHHNRFEFYVGAIYKRGSTTTFNEFQQVESKAKNRELYNNSGIREKYASARSLHNGHVYDRKGNPASAGCIRLQPGMVNYLWKNKSKILGCRVIVY